MERRATRRPSCGSEARPVPHRTCGPWGRARASSSTCTSPRRSTRSPRCPDGRRQASPHAGFARSSPRAPGGRPSARWVATRAARWLALRDDPAEAASQRVDRVRRTYLAARAADVRPGARPSAAIGEPARGWLREASDWARRLSAGAGRDGGRRSSRWGPCSGPGGSCRSSARAPSAWPIGGDDRKRGRAAWSEPCALARERDPAGWTLDDMTGAGVAVRGALDPWRAKSSASSASSASSPVRRPTRQRSRWPRTSSRRGAAPGALALPLASALARAGETGRAWAALAAAAHARRQTRSARSWHAGAINPRRQRPRPGEPSGASELADAVGRAGHARTPRLGSRRSRRGGAAARGCARPGGGRGAGRSSRGDGAPYEPALRALDAALSEPIEGDVHARLEGREGCWSSRGERRCQALRSVRPRRGAGGARRCRRRGGDVPDERGRGRDRCGRRGARPRQRDACRAALGAAGATRSRGARLAGARRIARDHRRGARCRRGGGRGHARGRSRRATRRPPPYARWAQVEVRPPGDAEARAWVIEADERLREGSPDDRARAAARLLVWAPDAVADARIAAVDATARERPARARALGVVGGARGRGSWPGGRTDVRRARPRRKLVALLDVPALLELAWPRARRRRAPRHRARGRRRRTSHSSTRARSAARALREGTPAEHAPRRSLSVAWARVSAIEPADVDLRSGAGRAARGDRPRALRAGSAAAAARAGARHDGALDGRRARPAAPPRAGRATRAARRAQPGPQTRPLRRSARALADDRPPRDRGGGRGGGDRCVLDTRRRSRQRPRPPPAQRPRRAARRPRRDARRRLPRRPRAQGRLRSARARVGARRRFAGRDGHRRRARRRAPASRGAASGARARPPRGRARASATRSSTSRGRSSRSPATAARCASGTTRSPAAASRCARFCTWSIASPAATSPCSSSARAGPARSSSRGRCTPTGRAAGASSSARTARACPRRCSSRRSSGT